MEDKDRFFEEKKRIIIELAKRSIKSKIEKGDVEEINIDSLNLDEKVKNELKQKHGVFVTIRKKRKLRGCIGTLAEDEIWKQVQKYAVFSSFNDPRFEPLEASELPEISIEVSIIKQVEDVKDISEIKIGEDGIIIDMKGKGGVLLPDVAIEYGVSSPEEFLNLLCKKIGVHPGSWKNAKIKKFKVEKISE